MRAGKKCAGAGRVTARWVGVVALAALSRPVVGAVLGFEAVVEDATVEVAEPIIYVIQVQTDGGRFNQRGLSQPDFGALRIEGAPAVQHETQIVNFRQTYTMRITYVLTAPGPGPYTIGPAELTDGGRRWRTNPIVIQVAESSSEASPPSLREEPILPPRTDSPELTQQLRGRLFVRPMISRLNPYVGEPIVLSYSLYQKGSLVQELRMNQPEFGGMLTETLYQARNFEWTRQVIDGEEFLVTLLYQVALTPTRPGQYVFEDFQVSFRLPFRERRRRSLFDDLDLFLESPFGSFVNGVARGGPLRLNVRPLPTVGQRPDFSGTVGSFTLASELDQTSATEDDLITLTVKIEGRGNVALAAVPRLPEAEDFELFDQSQSHEKWTDERGLAGRKTIEYLLRPRHPGSLTVPRLEYQIFDPQEERYRTLESPARAVTIARGRSTAVVVAGGAEGAGRPPDLEQRLRYIAPAPDLAHRTPRPLTESPLFWALQALPAAAAGVSLAGMRARERRDPARVRRDRAWGELERKLRRMPAGPGRSQAEAAAEGLERALREFVADRFNVSADGLTAEAIGRMLTQAGLPPEAAERLRAILDGCAQVRYAPLDAEGSGPAAWAEEARRLLAEVRS